MTDLEAARMKVKCLEMTEKTALYWWEVLMYRGQPCNTYPCFSSDHDEYEIAIGLLGGKPVWSDIGRLEGESVWHDSEIYTPDGVKCFARNLPGHILLSSCSWNPKPTTLTIDLPIPDVEYWAKLHRQIESGGYSNSYADYSLRFYAACQKALEARK